MSTIKTVVIRQGTINPKTIVVTRATSPIKTIVINKGLRGEEGPVGPTGPIADFVVERILLNSAQAAAKSFPLAYVPANPSAIELTPIGGIVQIYGIDYVYSSGMISWAGYGLDGFLEPSEYVLVRYLKESV